MSDHDDHLSAAQFAGEGDASRELGQRLRRVRRAQGMSLADVESRSGGRWSASAVGAYERGFRNLSIPRLKALADFYTVPIEVLLGDESPLGRATGPGLVFDLHRLRADMAGTPLERFTDAICSARGDYNGRVLSIRADDLQAVCAMVGGDVGQVVEQLREAGVLVDPADLAGLLEGHHDEPYDGEDRRATPLATPGSDGSGDDLPPRTRAGSAG